MFQGGPGNSTALQRRRLGEAAPPRIELELNRSFGAFVMTSPWFPNASKSGRCRMHAKSPDDRARLWQIRTGSWMHGPSPEQPMPAELKKINFIIDETPESDTPDG